MAETSRTPLSILSTLLVGAGIKYIFTALVRRRRLQYKLVGEISCLRCYPIKSCQGISVESGDCTPLGLRIEGNVFDRHWVVTDDKYNFLCAGIIPKLTLVQTHIENGQLIVDGPGMATLQLPTSVVVSEDIIICSPGPGKDDMEAVDCGDEASAWFSKYLDRTGVRLLHSAPSLRKRDISLEKKSWGNPAVTGDKAAFTDFCAYLVMSETTQTDVERILEEEVPLRNFRPTIIIKGNQPFEEDDWAYIKIGDSAELRVLYHTPRCIKINIDQTKGERIKKNIPLEKLKQFRCFTRYGRSPTLGVSAALDCEGKVKVGDPVYARLS